MGGNDLEVVYFGRGTDPRPFQEAKLCNEIGSAIVKTLDPPFDDYAVDEEGNVYSHKRNRQLIKLKPLKRRTQRYYYVMLRHNGQRKTIDIHRLVLETFVGPCSKGMECRHLNSNTSDNRRENLCWGTKDENVEDMIKHGHSTRGEKHPGAKLTESEVRSIRRAISDGKYSQREIAKLFSVSPTTICSIHKGGNWGWLSDNQGG